MATKKTKKTPKLEDLAAQPDRRAPLDSELLLKAAQPLLKRLAADLLERAQHSEALTQTLSARHADEQAKQRTADPYEVWLRFYTKQVAAAWFLSCVFVRVLEDRGLLEQHRIAGPGAMDSQQLFFELAPSLSERDYLLTVFRELSMLPGAAELFDAKHNPVWLLAPSREAAGQLLQLFRTPNPHEPALRFGQADTRFLGDLYQDLDEDVRERFALLQTPHFVESFILDRTLERAIERFGLDDTTLIDPTCGSGHFLLGAFERLLDHRLRAEPGLDVRVAAQKALNAVYGADINPYAIAIARFRLTLAFLEKGGYTRLHDAPRLSLHLAVADSLLHNPQRKLAYQRTPEEARQTSFGEHRLEDRGAWERSSLYELEDPEAVRDVLFREHAAVVGNPPYITVKDKALRERYRRLYPQSAIREYSLAAPFSERFFQLAREDGRVGIITANSFMKREFGKALVERFLPQVELDLIINTSGAYIPGHGTPTVMLFGCAREPATGQQILTVLAKRGEPSTPLNAERGLVWLSIGENWGVVGFENEFISVAMTSRTVLSKHPWSLGGGGATELKQLLETRASRRLGEVVESIGFMAITKQDEVFAQPRQLFARLLVDEEWTRSFVIGEYVRDWSISEGDSVLFPYTEEGDLKPLPPDSQAARFLWPYRAVLESRAVFGGQTFKESGRPWYAYGQIPKHRIRGRAITFAFVATHNHFVLDRGGKVFNRSAPIIKLPESATEDDHLALLAYLNSSTACFWMKQVFFQKSSQNYVGDVRDKPERIHYEFAGTQLEKLPIPELTPDLIAIARTMNLLAEERVRLTPAAFLSNKAFADCDDASRALDAARERYDSIKRRMVALQEDLDWLVYDLFQLSESKLTRSIASDGTQELDPSERPYLQNVPDIEDPRYRALQSQPYVRLIEQPMYKRPWFGAQGVFQRDERSYDDLFHDAVRDILASELEHIVAKEPLPTGLRYVQANGVQCHAIVELLSQRADRSLVQMMASHLSTDSVPFLDVHRFNESGLAKRYSWEQTWDLQRREDNGENVGTIPVPPKYDQKDFRDPNFFRLRGKLDVPKERFISYPGCESDEDGEPVYGWAGWNHLQQAQALAALYQARKQEGWNAERLTPMLAGLLELLPWLKQWHNDPNPEFDGLKLGDYFEGYLDGECGELGLTRDALRAWRPPAKGRGAGAAKATKAKPKSRRKAAKPDTNAEDA